MEACRSAWIDFNCRSWKRLGIHPNTIRAHIAEGHLTGYRVGRLVKVDPEDFETFVKTVDNRS
ncbi:helix-turn-helix domain-containing protein [Mycobacterium sp. 852002-51163_SCH5372311]|uniref:excisionase family DNA-binding protein n=1 Tax=Mycobacterium sp. 852002-51163_SCH5372311 TaxID=1834097 RepID=UPI0009ED887B